MKTLILVESPKKASTIKALLNDNYIVLASYGHITDLSTKDYNKLGIDVNNGFKTKYVLSDDKVSVLEQIYNAAKKVDQIIIMSDPDREGSVIADQLKIRLIDFNIPVRRATFNKITKTTILNAIKNAGEIDNNLVNAGVCRRIIDRIVGFRTSPYISSCHNAILSAGRVQSILARIIMEREQQIEQFIPETYFNIFANLSNDGRTSFTSKYAFKVSDKQTSDLVKSLIDNDETKEFIVSNIEAKEQQVKPPAALTTAEMQKLMTKKYKMTSEQVMKYAQNLYEGGYISYIRTDSIRLEKEDQERAKDYLKENNYDVPSKYNIYKNKSNTQDAHSAITPTDLSLTPDNCSEIADINEKHLYELIWRYFLASQMPNAIYNTLKLTIQLKSNAKIIFRASGKSLKYDGFYKMLGIIDNSKIDLPNLNKNDIVKLFGNNPIKIEEKKTVPPARYSESSLIDYLIKESIGRPSTFADVISKISTRGYVEKIGETFRPTELGRKINDQLIKYFSFMNIDFTSKMEDCLDEIAEGKKEKIDLLNEFYDQFKQELDRAYIDAGSEKCNKCQSMMVFKKNGKGEVFLGCSNYPNCRGIKNFIPKEKIAC